MTSTRTRKRIPLTCALGLLLVAAIITWSLERGHPAGKLVQGGTESGSTDDDAGQTVRLNFFNADWPRVLRKLAEETGSRLVMQRAPRGRLTRVDHRRYSRTEAVRLLNRELEPKGFRLLERGEHLVLLDLDMVRTRYRRPVVPASATRNGAETGAPTAEPNRDQTRIERNRRSYPATRAGSKVGPGYPDYGDAGRSRARRRAGVVRLAGESPEAGRSRRPAGGDWEAEGSASPTASRLPQVSQVAVEPRRRGALEIARMLHESLQRRSELIDVGPQGLPAFRVYDRPLGSRENDEGTGRHEGRGPSGRRDLPASVAFTVGIDVDRNRLIVEADSARQAGLRQLIHEFDTADLGRDGAIRLVATREDGDMLAQRLRPAIRYLLAQNQQNNTAQDRTQPQDGLRRSVQDMFQPAPQAGQPAINGQPPEGPPVVAPVPGEGEPLLRIQGLRGPVDIRFVPGIGLVVSGNREDVEVVRRLIQELQRVSGAQVPTIHLLLLNHVNSEALAALLNNVYQELTRIQSLGAQQEPSASIIAIVKPNALLIVGSQGVIDTIRDLAGQLDKPIDPRTEFQVIRLKHAVAAQVVTTLNALVAEEDQEGGGLRTRVTAVADARTNSVIVQGAPRDLAEVVRLIRRIDQDSSGSVNRMKVFVLKNAVAEELAQVINDTIQSLLSPAGAGVGQVPGQVGAVGAGGETAQRLQEIKSVVLEFLTGDGENEQIIRSGILADVRVTADTRSNALIVTAPEQSMAMMAELIRQLDEPSAMVAEIKVFPLENSDATAMADLLQTLFEPADEAQPGVQVVGAEDVSSSLIPLRFSVDVRTNSLIAIGGAEALRLVEAILLRLDEADGRQRRQTVIRLKNSPVIEVSDAVNAFLQSQRELAEIDPELVSNIELLEREIIVVPEPVSNSLLISATPRYFDEIIRIVNILDEAPDQVVIQVLIVEVELQNTDEFGVELGFQDSILFDRGLLNTENFTTIMETVSQPGTGIQTTTERIINEERVPGFIFNNQPLGNNTAINPSSVGAQGLSNFSLGRINGDLGFGGLVLSASSESISVLIRALASQRNVHILSRPQIRTLDNQLAQIQVGQQVPVISGVTTNALGGISPAIGTPQQVGILLSVTPRISPDGTIVMETIATKSALSGQGVPIIVDPTTGVPIESPIFDLTEARATVAVPDGQTIVLGGMITKQDDTIERKVPWLGDIPYLGVPFRFDSTATRRTELLIFMTPRIVRTDADSELIKQVETERIHFIEQEAEEIHGPIFAVPPQAPREPVPAYPQTPPGADFPVPPLPEDDADVPTTMMPAEPLDHSRVRFGRP